MSEHDPYRRIRAAGGNLIGKIAEVGHCVTCAPQRQADESDADYRLRLGAAAEQRAAEIVADLLVINE